MNVTVVSNKKFKLYFYIHKNINSRFFVLVFVCVCFWFFFTSMVQKEDSPSSPKYSFSAGPFELVYPSECIEIGRVRPLTWSSETHIIHQHIITV